VILADLTCRLSRSDASRYVDAAERLCAIKIGGWAPHELHLHEAEEVARDEAEGLRLAYVAATRARDLLVVPAVGDEPWEGGWVSPLNVALYPPLADRRSAGRGPKCPVFKARDSVAMRPNDEPAGPSTVCPGEHTFAAGGYAVVWWEPGSGGGLTLDEKPRYGLRREELIVKDVPRNVVADGRSRFDRWKLTREDARESGATPSLRVQTVREWAADQTVSHALAVDPASVSVVNVSRDETARSRGAAFGALVHAVLAQAPFEASAAELDDVAAVEARILGLSSAEASSAVEVVGRAFAHDLIRRASQAAERGACRRETPVTVTLSDGTLVEGIVDLAFEQDGVWWVIDYKTDRDLAQEGEAQYRQQIALYASAIAAATGSSVTGCLLRV
jgi:ATP-dependent exoDNAse (exonuclease V) beta subunit